MEELIQQFLEKVKTDKQALAHFKNAAVSVQQYELACKIREMEVSSFPKTDEQQVAYSEAKKVQGVLGLVDASASLGMCWAVNEAIKLYHQKGGSFNTDDASVILVKRNELFEREDISIKNNG